MYSRKNLSIFLRIHGSIHLRIRKRIHLTYPPYTFFIPSLYISLPVSIHFQHRFLPFFMLPGTNYFWIFVEIIPDFREFARDFLPSVCSFRRQLAGIFRWLPTHRTRFSCHNSPKSHAFLPTPASPMFMNLCQWICSQVRIGVATCASPGPACV